MLYLQYVRKLWISKSRVTSYELQVTSYECQSYGNHRIMAKKFPDLSRTCGNHQISGAVEGVRYWFHHLR